LDETLPDSMIKKCSI